MLRSVQGEDLGLGSEHVNAGRAVRLGKHDLPLLDPTEYQRHELDAAELATSRVDPDDRLARFGADEDHVVVRRDDDLVRPRRVLEDDRVARTALRSAVALVADVARSDAQLPQRAGYSPRKKFIEEEPDRWP